MNEYNAHLEGMDEIDACVNEYVTHLERMDGNV